MTPIGKKRVRKPRIVVPVELPQTPEEFDKLLGIEGTVILLEPEKGRQAGEEAEATINPSYDHDTSEAVEHAFDTTLHSIWYNIFRYLFAKSRNIGGELHMSRPFVRRVQTLLGKKWADMTQVDKDFILGMMKEVPK